MKGREGYNNPKEDMALKRVALLVLGTIGSFFAVTMLYISAEGIIAGKERPQFSTFTEPLQENLVTTTDCVFPYKVPGTTLIAQKIFPYDGPFLEDGSDREVFDVAALQICNIGSREISKAYIEIKLDDSILTFYGEHIPPGIPVLLLECDAKTYGQGSLTACTGWQIVSESNIVTEKEISITDRPMGTVAVTNLTEHSIHSICLYYKSWLSPPNIYVGGITYFVNIPILEPGQTEYLYPQHYASGFSKIVSVTVGVQTINSHKAFCQAPGK